MTAVDDSMEWLKVFRPAGFVATLAAARVPAIHLTDPLTRLVDRAASRFVGRPEPKRPTAEAFDASEGEFRDFLAAIEASQALPPNRPDGAIDWRLAEVGADESLGPLFRRVVLDRRGRPIGCYMFRGKLGRVGWTLQVTATPENTEVVIDWLFADAAKTGCVAIKGRMQSHLLDALLTRGALLFRRQPSLAQARRPELMQAVQEVKP